MKSNTIANLKTLALTAVCTVALVWAYTPANAATTSANHGHHGGGNSGALGAAPGAGATSSAAAGQSGNGSSYGDWYLRTSAVDNFQPFPQSEVQQYAKPKFIPYAGE